MRSIVLSVAFLSMCLASCGKNKPKDPDAPAPETTPKLALTPLYRFWDNGHNEHVYTYEGTEPVEWRKNPAFQRETVVAYGVNSPDIDAVKLHRWYRKDGRHYFYIKEQPKGFQFERLEDFTLYVWTTPGNGRIPIHASFDNDSLDAYFDKSLENVKSYSAGKQRNIVENYFWLYPTGPAPSNRASAAPPNTTPGNPAKPAAQEAWVVGLWMGKVGNQVATVRYFPDGYFEESPTGSSSDMIHGTYKVRQNANGLEIQRDVGGTIIPEFQDQTKMTHPIGAAKERVVFQKYNAPDDSSQLKQKQLTPEAQSLRDSLVGKWQTQPPVTVGGQKQVHVLEYKGDGTFSCTITATGQAPRTINGRWVIEVNYSMGQTGKAQGLTISRFVEGKLTRSIHMTFLNANQINHGLFEKTDEYIVFERQK